MGKSIAGSAVDRGAQKGKRRPRSRNPRILTTLFREIVLLRDSSEIICRELRSCDSILKALHEVACKPAGLRAAAVRGADGWKEVHYSTGQKDGGRLYFRRTGDKVLARVSFKNVQARDIEYLRKHD